jgi:hypothetical protein
VAYILDVNTLLRAFKRSGSRQRKEIELPFSILALSSYNTRETIRYPQIVSEELAIKRTQKTDRALPVSKFERIDLA